MQGGYDRGMAPLRHGFAVPPLPKGRGKGAGDLGSPLRGNCALPLPVAEEGRAQFPQPRHWRPESEAGPGMAIAARRAEGCRGAPRRD